MFRQCAKARFNFRHINPRYTMQTAIGPWSVAAPIIGIFCMNMQKIHKRNRLLGIGGSGRMKNMEEMVKNVTHVNESAGQVSALATSARSIIRNVSVIVDSFEV
jgi:hypothetical protein